MLLCTVYLHICSDSLHLISEVDYPRNMDRHLQRMHTKLYPIYRLLCSVCNFVPLLLSSSYSKYNPHTKILELIWLNLLLTLKAIQYMPSYIYSHLFFTAQIIIRTPVGTSSNVTIMTSLHYHLVHLLVESV